MEKRRTNPDPLCTYCGKTADLECGECGTKYCSEVCQKKDWSKHKLVCKRHQPSKQKDVEKESKPLEAHRWTEEDAKRIFNPEESRKRMTNYLEGKSYKPTTKEENAVVQYFYESSSEEEEAEDEAEDKEEKKEIEKEEKAESNELDEIFEDETKKQNAILEVMNKRREMLRIKNQNLPRSGKFNPLWNSSDDESEGRPDDESTNSGSAESAKGRTNIGATGGRQTNTSIQQKAQTVKAAWSMSNILYKEAERKKILGKAWNWWDTIEGPGGRVHQWILYRSLHQYQIMWGESYFSTFKSIYESQPDLYVFYKDYMRLKRLDMGITWVDITAGTVDNPAYNNYTYYYSALFTFWPITAHKPGYTSTNANTGLLYDSFHGKYQYWHSMAPSYYEKLTNSQLRDVIVLQAREWFLLSLAPAWPLRHIDTLGRFSDKFIPDIFCIGHIIHMIEDSYAKGHVDRDPVTVTTVGNNRKAVAPILNFIDYRATSEKQHKLYDGMKAYDKGDNRPTYYIMREQIATLLRMYSMCVNRVQEEYQQVVAHLTQEVSTMENARPGVSEEIKRDMGTRVVTDQAIISIGEKFFDDIVMPFLIDVVYYIREDRLDERSGQLVNIKLKQTDEERTADKELVEKGIIPPKNVLKKASIDILLSKPAFYDCTHNCGGDEMKEYEDALVHGFKIGPRFGIADYTQHQIERSKMKTLMREYIYSIKDMRQYPYKVKPKSSILKDALDAYERVVSDEKSAIKEPRSHLTEEMLMDDEREEDEESRNIIEQRSKRGRSTPSTVKTKQGEEYKSPTEMNISEPKISEQTKRMRSTLQKLRL